MRNSDRLCTHVQRHNVTVISFASLETGDLVQLGDIS